MSENNKRKRPRSFHWGQLDEEEEINMEQISSSSADPTATTTTTKTDKNKSWSSFDVPPLYQPRTQHAVHHKNKNKEKNKTIAWMKPPLDTHDQNFIYQSIELQHFKRRMRYMLSAAHSHQNEIQKGTNMDSPVLPSPPIPPKRFCSSEGRLISRTQPTFMCGEFTASSGSSTLDDKNFVCPIELDTVAARQLMYKAVAAGTAHAGFEFATETALNTLTDVTAEFSSTLCKSLKSFVEYQRSGEDIIDGLSHVLKQHTCGDVVGLQEYWLNRVKHVALKLEKEGLQLLEEYNTLKDSSIQRVEIKQEKL